MKLLTTIAVFGTIAAVSSQDISLPKCAEPCIDEGLSSSTCDPTDYVCQCADTKALDAIMSCVQQSCDASQIPAVIAAASAICAEFGGPMTSMTSSAAVASTVSSMVSEMASSITSAVNAANVSKTTVTTTRTTFEVTGTVTQGAPTTTAGENAAFKMTVGGGFGAIAALVGLLAGL
ncbi:hypothetical protein ABW21_db0205918 [Orbilia brochopaga]|nr:hypothetical protein ABW21_db0205918 [Drechslerella brochopaga]